MELTVHGRTLMVEARSPSRSWSKKKKEWRMNVHGRTFTVEARSPSRSWSSSFVGSLKLIFEFSTTFQQLEVLK